MKKANKKSTPAWFNEAKKIMDESKLDEGDSKAILDLLVLVSENSQKAVTAQVQREQKQHKVKAAKTLLQNYPKLKMAVESGIARTVDVLDDTEIQRLMEREDSVKNQQVRSLALQAATNRVLLLQIDSALSALKTVCNEDQDPRFRRQYDVLYYRYIKQWSIDAILTMLSIERTTYYETLNHALHTFSVILFGATSAEDFFPDNSIFDE